MAETLTIPTGTRASTGASTKRCCPPSFSSFYRIDRATSGDVTTCGCSATGVLVKNRGAVREPICERGIEKLMQDQEMEDKR